MEDQLKKLDAWVYRGERTFVVAALAVMSVVVFLDVVHRTFASESNKFVDASIRLLGFVGVEIELGSASHQSFESAAPYLLWVGFSAVAYFGIQTAHRRDPMPVAKAAGFSVIGVVAVYGLIRLFLRLFPNGLIWSQPLALVLTLWVGFIGASMCTYDNKHLKVEAIQRYIPDNVKHYVAALSGAFTTIVCLVLLWLSLRYVIFSYDEYVGTDGQGGLFQGLGVAKYQCFAALPVSFAIMAARFTMVTARAFRGELPTRDPLEGLLEEAAPHGLGVKPSDVPTEVSGRKRASADGEPLPSEVPTEAVKISGDEDDEDPPQRRPTSSPGRGAGNLRAVAGELGGSGDGGEDDEDADDEEDDAR